jgi:hypothetical protein
VFFRVVTQRVVVISYRSFGTNYRSHLEGSRIQEEEEEEKIEKGKCWGGGEKSFLLLGSESRSASQHTVSLLRLSTSYSELMKGKGKCVPVHVMETYRERGCIAPLILTSM